MRACWQRIAAIPALAAAAGGCGGGGSDNTGPGPDPPVLTSVEVTPATTALFTVSPGNTVQLTAVPQDQTGETMAGLGAPSFSSQNEAIATVGNDGTVTAVGAGSTQITASVTAGDVTETGTATVTVQVAPVTAAVTAPALLFQPQLVDVSAGGRVTWTFGALHHDVTFSTPGAPQNIPLMENGSASRDFPDNGTFQYRCSIHQGMNGTVRVH
jgi:plastocyanin